MEELRKLVRSRQRREVLATLASSAVNAGGVLFIILAALLGADLARRDGRGDGMIIESGTHDELTAGGGHYAELFSLQAARRRIRALRPRSCLLAQSTI